MLTEDLVFACPSCEQSISADRNLLGQTAECPYCHTHFSVGGPPPAENFRAAAPDFSSGTGSREELAALHGQLRENRTQTTELRGNMSRLNMELHRHQLRLNKLLERQEELNSSIRDAEARRDHN